MDAQPLDYASTEAASTTKRLSVSSDAWAWPR